MTLNESVRLVIVLIWMISSLDGLQISLRNWFHARRIYRRWSTGDDPETRIAARFQLKLKAGFLTFFVLVSVAGVLALVMPSMPPTGPVLRSAAIPAVLAFANITIRMLAKSIHDYWTLGVTP